MNRHTGEVLTKEPGELCTPGDYMRYAREVRGYTLYGLRLKSGINESIISAWENGRHMPVLDSAAKVCDALGISIDEYIGRKVKEKRHDSN